MIGQYAMQIPVDSEVMTVTPVNAIAIWDAPAGSAARVEANDPISRIPISTNVEVFIFISFIWAASSAFRLRYGAVSNRFSSPPVKEHEPRAATGKGGC